MKLHISIEDQTLELRNGDEVLRRYAVSTATKGIGFQNGSYRTPVGRFRISGKIGEGQALGTIFRERLPAGLWQADENIAGDLVTTRILLLDGLDESNKNTLERYIYIHGTNHEDRIGQPCSHGCVRMHNADVIELFDLIPTETEVFIEPPTKKSGKIIFFDCDSTLSSIEGIDELARFRGEETFREVEQLTNAAMNGQVPLNDVFRRRMEIIRPDQAACDAVAQQYIDTIVSGVEQTLAELRAQGWMIAIISGGFAPLIRPLADKLGIAFIEAVPLHLDDSGNYHSYGSDYPTTRNGGKPEIIREWKNALLPTLTVMVGDGMSDCETIPEVDCFIGFGGVVAREKVRLTAPNFVTDFSEISQIIETLTISQLA
jgi:phosphoserine phosphatase SerB